MLPISVKYDKSSKKCVFDTLYTVLLILLGLGGGSGLVSSRDLFSFLFSCILSLLINFDFEWRLVSVVVDNPVEAEAVVEDFSAFS